MRRALWVAAAIATLASLESSVRALESSLPEVNRWREPLVNAKVLRMNELGRSGGAQVVLAGSSQMLFAGDPAMLRNLGLPWQSYNAALWAAPPTVNRHWILDVVVPRLRPKTVVLGVSPVDFVRPDSDLGVQQYFQSTAVRNDVLGEFEREAERRSALVRHKRSLRSPKIVVDSVLRLLRGEAGPALHGAGVSPYGRMANRDNEAFRADGLARETIAGVVDRHGKVSQQQLDAFRATVNALRRTGIEVLVADMAISRPLIDLLGKGRDYESFRSFLKAETDALGVPLLDTAGGVTDTKFFIDFDHVNRAGANIFNTVIGRLLRGAAPGTFATRLQTGDVSRPLAPALAKELLPSTPTPAPRALSVQKQAVPPAGAPLP